MLLVERDLDCETTTEKRRQNTCTPNPETLALGAMRALKTTITIGV